LTYRRVNLRDLSAAVTGVIISMLMPPAIDLTVIVVASLFAILVCKAPFGGTGHNIFNPAAAGVAFAI
ncbi:RnfABCDGE type electron transport complex subunit D, partial [Acinetobacter sp. 163]|nr:RnfABCDGE type electron transport complex subunit D [Acinetobacter sp. 163]